MRTTIKTSAAPAAIGPYNQGIKVNTGHIIFTAGQIPLDPKSGQMVDGDIQKQTRRVLENVKAVVESAGASMQHIVKTTVFLTDLNNFAAMNEVYAEFFPENSPARSTVEVSGLPKGAGIEIEAVAVIE